MTDNRRSRQGYWTAIINILHLFKKIEESMSMLRRDTGDTEVLKDPNWTSRDKKHTQWD